MNLSQIRLIIFDADGTLVKTKSGETFRKSADDWLWLPGRLERLLDLAGQGIVTAVATNQGGVAMGYLDRDEMRTQLSIMCNQAQITHLYVCYSHPQAREEIYKEEIDLFDRKPMPGMLFKTMLEERVTVAQTLFVGDRDEDEQAAKNAGCNFAWSHEFF